MASWASLAAATSDLRTFVNDGPVDRLVKEKVVIGATNGVNTTYMTWEDRIIGATLVVTIDYVPYPGAFTQALDANGINLTGTFTLATPGSTPPVPPVATAVVRAQYYFQYFLDAELQEALFMAANEMIETDDPTQVPSGLKYAMLYFAGSFAYQKLAIRWAQVLSNRFLVVEEPSHNENMQRPNMFQQIAKSLWDQGTKLRDGYYMRHGRRNAPAFNRYYPRIPIIGPRT